jgi:hypothetical protein
MREKATLKLDNGAELRVELDSEDLDRRGDRRAPRVGQRGRRLAAG